MDCASDTALFEQGRSRPTVWLNVTMLTASPNAVAAARRAVRSTFADHGGTITDLSVMKLGRTHLVSVYYNPQRPIGAGEVDQLNLRMIHEVREALPGADVILIISEHPRRWPEELNPF